MRTPCVLLLALGCAVFAWAQAPGPPSNPPPPDAAKQPQVPAPGQAAEAAAPSPRPPMSLPLPAGTAIFLHIVEPAKTSTFQKVEFRNMVHDPWAKYHPDDLELGLYKKLAKEFEKDGRFRLVGQPGESGVVFFLLSFARTKSSNEYLALALPPDEYQKNVEMLNPFRGVAHLEKMLPPAALWISSKSWDPKSSFKPFGPGTSPADLGRSSATDLVKEFCRDTR